MATYDNETQITGSDIYGNSIVIDFDDEESIALAPHDDGSKCHCGEDDCVHLRVARRTLGW